MLARIIDEHTGTELYTGQTLRNNDGSGFVIIDAMFGLLSATLTIVTFDINQAPSPKQTVRLPIHFLHPAFFLQRVVFIPA